MKKTGIARILDIAGAVIIAAIFATPTILFFVILINPDFCEDYPGNIFCTDWGGSDAGYDEEFEGPSLR